MGTPDLLGVYKPLASNLVKFLLEIVAGEVKVTPAEAMTAYLYLPRASRDKSQRTVKAPGGLVIDFTRSGKVIGIEITAPSKATFTAVSRVLKELGFPPIMQSDLAPRRAR